MSTLRVNAIQDTNGNTQYTCRAWVNFNGTGTVAIRAAGGVSSITDVGVGDYYVNLSTALADSNGSLAMSGGQYTSGQNYPVQGPNGYFINTSQAYVWTGSDSTGRADWIHVYVTVWR